jgi:hypothetical protein
VRDARYPCLSRPPRGAVYSRGPSPSFDPLADFRGSVGCSTFGRGGLTGSIVVGCPSVARWNYWV